MCTVSFVPTDNGVIITSNRDEKRLRKPALLPQTFIANGKQLIYPTDGNAGGTWFITRNDGSVGVLLNGAFAPHAVKEKYRISRGIILPQIFAANNPLTALQGFDLTNIENCTILIYHQQQLHTCKWNGESLFIEVLDTLEPHIFSSVTLYNTLMIIEKEKWFNQWLQKGKTINQQACISFHTNAGKGNSEYGLQINRNNEMLTVSVTSVIIKNSNASLFYKDCIQQISTQKEVELIATIANMF